MGTRNLTMVINQKGETKVAQYGQWDGYPEGQGVTCLEFLTNCDLDLFKKQLDKLEFFTDEEIEKLDENFDLVLQERPYLTRDLGAKILRAIHEGVWTTENHYTGVKTTKEFTVDKLVDNSDFAADSLFCEWAYVIDLQKETFEVYKGWNKDLINENERFSSLEPQEKANGGIYHPIRLEKEFKLSELPTKEEFLEVLNQEEDED